MSQQTSPKISPKQLSQTQKKQFRTLGHKLKPIVTIGDKGLSKNVGSELDRALEDHELIKIKLPALLKDDKQELVDNLCKSTKSEKVQQVGKMLLLYRAAKKANPKLSNLLRELS